MGSKFVTSEVCQVAYCEFSIFGTINQQRFGTQSAVSTNPFAEILLVKGGLGSPKVKQPVTFHEVLIA